MTIHQLQRALFAAGLAGCLVHCGGTGTDPDADVGVDHDAGAEPTDAGAASTCGDATCDADETCFSCSSDCGVCTAEECAALTPSQSVSDTWVNLPQSDYFSTLRITYMARASVANVNALVAVSQSDLSSFPNAAVLVRFSEAGVVDAYDGTGYRADTSFPYVPGTWYSVAIDIDLVSQTFSASVGACGDAPTPFVSDAEFRSTAPFTGTLSNLGIWASSTGALDVADISFTGTGTTPPATWVVDTIDTTPRSGEPPLPVTITCNASGSAEGDIAWEYRCDGGDPWQADPSQTGVDATFTDACVYESSGTYAAGCRSTRGGISAVDSTNVNVGTPGSSYPDETNTGPSDVGALVPSGGITVTTDGTVIENVDVTGSITIRASNVTVRNFRITGDSFALLNARDAGPGCVFEDGEIYDNPGGDAVDGSNYTARRLYIHGMAGDAFKAHQNVTVERSYVHSIGQGSGAHGDGIQASPNTNIRMLNNTFWLTTGSLTAAYFGESSGTNVEIRGNRLSGGAYTIYCNGDMEVEDNVFGRHASFWVLTGSCASWERNTWDDNGALLPTSRPAGCPSYDLFDPACDLD